MSRHDERRASEQVSDRFLAWGTNAALALAIVLILIGITAHELAHGVW